MKMTAQEWLDALKQQENAATPGPYILDGMYPIYSLGRGGLKDKTVACANSKFDGDYIVAACNSVPRLIDMIEYLAGRLCDENQALLKVCFSEEGLCCTGPRNGHTLYLTGIIPCQ